MLPSKLDREGLVSQVTLQADIRLPGSAIPQPPMGPVVIVLPEITGDAFPGFFQVPVFGQSNFLFLQAAMKAFDVAVSFRVMVSKVAQTWSVILRLVRFCHVTAAAFSALGLKRRTVTQQLCATCSSHIRAPLRPAKHLPEQRVQILQRAATVADKR